MDIHSKILFIFLLNIFLVTFINGEIETDSKQDLSNGNVISETETQYEERETEESSGEVKDINQESKNTDKNSEVSSGNVDKDDEGNSNSNIKDGHSEEQQNPIEMDFENDFEKPVHVNKVKVIVDNVTGNKHSSFSEDQSSNRDDETTVSDIKEQAEQRLKDKTKIEALDKVKNGNIDEEIESVENADLQSDESGKENENVAPQDESTLEQSHSEKQEQTDIPNVNVQGNHENPKQTHAEPGMDGNTKDGKGKLSSEFQGLNFENEKKTLQARKDVENYDNHAEKLTKEPYEKEFDSKEKLKSSEGQKDELKTPIDHSQNLKDKIQPGESEFNEGMVLLNQDNKDYKKAYKLFVAAADLGHPKALEQVAYPYLFGDHHIRRNMSKAVEIFHQLSEIGSPIGQQGLGFLYGSGLNVNSSQAKALIYTTFSALGGDTKGQMMLGYRYVNGIGVAQSCEAALTYYKKVAKKVSEEASPYGGNAIQKVRLYDELEQPGGTPGQIDEDLLQYYQFLADKGDLSAQIGLGQLYFQGGRGIDINFEKAFKYFQLAGNAGNGNGLAYLGKMYLEGLYVKKDTKSAYQYFKKASDQSNPIGQAGLGLMYLKGVTVKKNYDAAIKYFSLAAEQGWVEGQLQLGKMYYDGIGVKKDYRQAVKYFTFASQSGHVLALYNLATMHATGAGVMRSCHTATEFFKNVAERGKWSMIFMDAYDAYKSGDIETALLKYYLLAELGHEIAQSNVAYILDKGDAGLFSINQTYARALLQWSRAAHQGYAIARVKVGDYHYYGLGTKVDYETAALHYRLASDQQANPQAMFNLGYMHEQGFGLKKDIHLAKRFYDMAAEVSVDAQFPVYIALTKLTFYLTWEWLVQNYRFWEHFDPERIRTIVYKKLGPDWDIYLMTLLAGILIILLLFRRAIRH